ncbi:MAG: hypothetical protein JJU28_07165 [Cyclobacteriaceae bacterium]|nr:hypothetical protein [Cyclobacteriaceae bacterium]
MKLLISVLLTLMFLGNVLAQDGNPNYDQKLADFYGADDYGMKMYVLVILKSGSSEIKDAKTINELFRGHLDNINIMAEQGKLLLAGPLGKNDVSYRGIFVLNTDHTDTARLWLQSDPAIREKLLETELFNWYGSAALASYLETADKIWKIKP